MEQFLQQDWGCLTWTHWIRFSEAQEYRKQVPNVAGMYRIKPVGVNRLVYIGQTGRNLRERVLDHLIKHTLTEDMPFNDPHTAAPSLWALAHGNGWEFEVSVVPIAITKE